MKRLSCISSLAIATSLGWALPAQAQAADDDAALRAELAEMRQQMQAMAARIDTLESELEQADAKADAASQAASEASVAAAAASDAAAKPVKVEQLSKDDGWSVKLRGRMQVDAGIVHASDAVTAAANAKNPGGLGFGNEFRRLYLGVDGKLPGSFGYRIEADFANSDVSLTDVYLTYDASKDLRITLGQHKPFWGLEEGSSDLFTTMMERAAINTAFGNERRIGLSASYTAGAVLAQGGVFSDDADALLDDANNGFSVDGRLVLMPKIGGGQLHIGGSAHHRTLNDAGSNVSYSVRPFVHTSDTKFITTGTIAGVESETTYGLELGYFGGPFHAMGETRWQHVSRSGVLAEPTFFGGYAEVGYSLTGDGRSYKAGSYDRTKPANPVGDGGMGALELNLRYDYLDLVDAGIIGGTQNTYAVSLVWVPTDYTRFILNYGHVEYDQAAISAGGDTSYGVDAVGMRAQFDF